MAKCEHSGCNTSAMKNSRFCFWHDPDPDVVAKRLAAASKGGCGSRKVLSTEDIEGYDFRLLRDIDLFLGRLIGLVATGRVDVPIARACGFMANCVASLRSEIEFDDRLKKVEERVIQLEGSK